MKMGEYIATSLETHLFFGRIMKEHALFLQAGFPAGEVGYRNKADWYRRENEYNEIVLLKQNYVSSAKYVCVAGIMKRGESAEDTFGR